MKELGNKIIVNIHLIIMAYAAYGTLVLYEEHSQQVEALNLEAPTILEQIGVAGKKIKEIESATQKTEEYKARVEGVAKSIEDVQKQLPAETNDSEIMGFLNAEIGTINIKNTNVTSGKEEPSTYFISKEYKVNIKGTFLQFLIFLERIGSAKRIYNIKNLKIVSSLDTKKGRYQIVEADAIIQAYRFNPNFKVDRGFDKIEKVK